MALMDLRKISRRLVKKRNSGEDDFKQETTSDESKDLKRSVSFGTVSVREFERVLDVNPACTQGPSIGIGWNYQVKQDIPLSKWEKQKISRRNSIGGKSSSDFFPLPQYKREKLAKQIGYSEQEIEKNIQRVERLQTKRKESCKDKEIDPDVILVQRVTRALQKRKQEKERQAQLNSVEPECEC